MAPLPDGTYDVIVVDAETADDGDLEIDLAITLGPHRGDVIRLRGRHVERAAASVTLGDPALVLGVPGVLRVRQGRPTFRPEA